MPLIGLAIGLMTMVLSSCAEDDYLIGDYYEFVSKIEVSGGDVVDLYDVIKSQRYSSSTLVIPASVCVRSLEVADRSMMTSIADGNLLALKAGDTFIYVCNALGDRVATIPVVITSDAPENLGGGDDPNPWVDPDRVTVKLVDVPNNKLVMERYGSFKLTEPLPGAPGDETPKYFTFTSSNPTACEVNIFGMISARNYGHATIVVFDRLGRAVSVIEVTVKSPAELVSFPTGRLQMVTFDTVSLIKQPYDYPITTISNTYTFTSSDPSVVEVSQYGDLLAKAVGNAVITVKYRGLDDVLMTLQIRVEPTDYLTLSVGEERDLASRLSPGKYSLSNLRAENPTIVYCNLTTVIKALAPGSTVITSSPLPGKKQVYIIVTVK